MSVKEYAYLCLHNLIACSMTKVLSMYMLQGCTKDTFMFCNYCVDLHFKINFKDSQGS